MKSIQLIYFISTHPEFTNIVIADEGDRTPMQAIERLSSDTSETVWRINGTLEKRTLLVFN